MKPPPFDYLRADTLDEALDALAAAGPDARVLAGGQSLLPMLNMRLVRPTILVDVMRIGALRTVEARGGALEVGAAVRQVELERRADLDQTQPLLAAALRWVGHAQTRNRGTVCGSIAHADPSAELPLALVALGGEIRLRSRRKRRVVAAETFFAGSMATERRDDEMIESVTFPLRKPGTGYAFREIGRRHGDFAIVACAALVDATSARLAIGGVADRPVARALPLPGPDLDEALDGFAWSLEARDDIHATARYRRDLVRRLGRQVIEEAARCRG
ncbi:FAD binding domain-containing protein [Enterovirga sp.]|uniref:FAD binding domain-containing protein n=1 Tax=Enterovirga sp. TaxID=2026350 RepID=UPI0026324F00|nr:FAD binding domain-containing protein [Enterovirga sp.]MDB5590150.1 molybdopterin dehydrogenase FAD-binding [Enterovirga sp.]